MVQAQPWRSTVMITWDLDQATQLIRELQPLIRAVNYHITLGGSVLNSGQSKKDLDLFIEPLNGYETDSRAVVILLISLLGNCEPLRDSPDYHHDALFHYGQAVKFDYCGKRIDVFVR